MYTFITETNNQSKKSKCINKNAADSELKTKITKLICSTDHIWDMKWTESKAKIIMLDCIVLISLPFYNDKKYIPKNGYNIKWLSHFHKSAC